MEDDSSILSAYIGIICGPFIRLVKKYFRTKNMSLCVFHSFTDPPADEAGDPLKKWGYKIDLQ